MPHRCERNFLARVSTRVLPALLAQTESRSLKEYRKTLSGKNSVADLIARRIDDMSGAVARIGRYVSLYPERVINQTIVELGEATNTGQATIIRFCRLLGFHGFRDIKLALVDDIATERNFVSGQAKANADLGIERLNSSLQLSIQKTAELVDVADMATLARAISATPRAVVFGGGVSQICASLLEYRLLRLGVPVFCVTDSRLAYIAAQKLPANGMAFAVSLSGITADTLDFMKAAQEAGAKTVAITAREKGPLADIADHVLPFHLPGPWPMEGSIRYIAPFVVVVEALAQALDDEMLERRGI